GVLAAAVPPDVRKGFAFPWQEEMKSEATPRKQSLVASGPSQRAIWITLKGNTMKDKDKTIDPLPDSFETEEQAGAFWDAHSTMDYQQHLEATDDTIEISERVFEVQVAEDVFKKLQEQAASLRQPVPEIVDEILRKELVR